MRNTVVLFLVAFLVVPGMLFAQGEDELSSASRYDAYAGTKSMGPSIVASTSWVGAIAEAGGAQDVLVLAPVELRHPPEYDFSPQDIVRASQADLVFWAGYEGFVKNLIQAAELSENRLINVQTNNAPDKLSESAAAVSRLLGTEEAYGVWKEQLDVLSSRMLEGAEAQEAKDTKVAVQFHHQALARYLGYDVIHVYGPQELTMNDIRDIEAMNPDLIMDNWHSPQGAPLQKDGRQYVQLVNFPGPFDTTSILDVLEYNARQLSLIP